MKNVTYINASAGSGKTYTLTHILAELIAGNKEKPKESLIDKFVKQIAGHQVEPEKVIMTTFTVKAANEMKEEAKKVLYEMNLFEEAARLDQAKIGTIHSVANALINKYWFFLGLSPEMGVMAEEDTSFYISQSLSDLPTQDQLKTLHGFCDEFNILGESGTGKWGKNYDFWKDDLKKVIDYTTNYEIENYKCSKDESLAYIKQFVNYGLKTDYSKEELLAVLDEHSIFLDSQKQSDKNDKRKTTLKTLRREVDSLTVDWYRRLANMLNELKKCGPLATEMREQLRELWSWPLVYEKQEAYIHLLFDLAEKWKEGYAKFKKEQNLLDYNDMEKYMLKLLEDKKLSAEISEDYRYLFVDEFQDCSPIQVKIFDRLSELMEHSIWVGDSKQAIYGFRGSDIKLTQAVIDRIREKQDGCEMAPSLDTSRRSLPDIVKVCNETFKQTFKQFNEDLEEDAIVLKEHRENKEDITSLRYWDMTAKGAPDISAYIAQLVQKVQQQKVEINEIAVLGRDNKSLDKIASALTKYNIPTNRGMKVMDMSATTLVMALLALVASENDSLAKAQIAYLTEKDFGTGKLIEEKLQFDAEKENDSKDFLNNVPLVKRLLELRPMLMQQSVAALVETMIIELDLYNEVKKLGKASESVSCLNAIIKTAQTYEQRCVQMNLPATVNGFMDYLEVVNPVGQGDANGVQLNTYHSSKGLAWKYVILTSLNETQGDQQKIIKYNIYGIHSNYIEEPTAENPTPEVYVRITPFIYDKTAKNFDIQKHIIGTPLYRKVEKDALSESNRLLYVGMTRPRDVMILALETYGKEDCCALEWFMNVGLDNVNVDLEVMSDNLLGVGIDFEEEVLTAEFTPGESKDFPQYETEEEKMKTRRIPYMSEICTDERKYVSPSSLHKKGSVEQHFDICERMPKGNSDDDAKVGDCIHQIFCSIEQQIDDEKYYKDLIDSYGLTTCLKDIEAIKKAWTSLTSWLTKQYGEAKHVYHERPFSLQKDGQVFTGSIDLVWQTAEGDILIDFKTCPMGHNYILNKESKHYAGWYAGQLDVYADALEAAGEKVIKRCIYYPVSGMICEISRPVD